MTMGLSFLLLLSLLLVVQTVEGLDKVPRDYELNNVRLVGGGRSWQGRVEVLYGGEWGTICDDSWNDNAAQVVCRMLKYSTSNAKAYGSARFGQGSVPILLDDVSCRGYEQTLTQCHHQIKGHHNCNHNEDAGVDCFPPDFTTAAEMETTTESYSIDDIVIMATQVACDDRMFNVTVDIDRLRPHGLGNGMEFNHITLGEKMCSGHRLGNELVLYAPIAECVPNVHEASSFVYYSGNLRIYQREEGGITREHVTKVEIECILKRNLTVEGEYVINEPRHAPSIINAEGSFKTSMEFYRDQFFYHRINQWPHEVGLGESLFVQISVDSDDPDLRLVVESCMAKPFQNDTSRTYWLVRNGCPVDSTTSILPSGEDFARFEFSSFEFVGTLPEVFLDCQVTVCGPHDPAPHCQSVRCPRSSLDKRSRQTNHPIIHVRSKSLITRATGPKRFEGVQLDVSIPEKKGTPGSPMPAVGLGLATVGILLALVGLAVFLKRKISGPVYVV